MNAPDPSLDEIDLQILGFLQEDARVSHAEIGRRVGLVPSAIFQRVQKLESGGVILSHETRVAPTAVGFGLAAYIFVRAETRVGSRDTLLCLADLAEVQEAHDVAGEDCYLLKVRVPDAPALGRFLRDKVAAVDGVESTRTTVVLDTVKETTRLPLEQTPVPG